MVRNVMRRDSAHETILAVGLVSAPRAMVNRKAWAVIVRTGTCHKRLSNCVRRAATTAYTSGIAAVGPMPRELAIHVVLSSTTGDATGRVRLFSADNGHDRFVRDRRRWCRRCPGRSSTGG